jgi:5-methylthioadenosine/S-adenosylhomocysteine deaminase
MTGGTLFTDVRTICADNPATLSASTDVLVLGDRIAEIGASARGQATPDCFVFEGHGRHLLVPGLINAHFHSSTNHMKGALPSMPLEVFMLYESPADRSPVPSPRAAYVRTMLACIDMLRLGTTSVQDDAFFVPFPADEAIDAVMQAYADCGIRATVALDQPTLPESSKLPYLDEFPPALRPVLDTPAPVGEDQLLDTYQRMASRWHGADRGRLQIGMSVSAPQRVSLGYFHALDDLSRKLDVPLFVHVLETKAQRTLMTEQPRFAGESLVAYIDNNGLLTDRTNVIHAVWIDDGDLARIAATGSVVIHNPMSNLRLGSGIAPYRRMRNAGIPVALGLDEAICGDSNSMWEVIRTAGLIHNITGEDYSSWPSAEEILQSLWGSGARAMRRAGELGRLEVGCLADLAVLDLNSRAFTPLNSVCGQLVYCETGASVEMTMVAGRKVFERGRLTLVDEAGLLEEARERFSAGRDRGQPHEEPEADTVAAYRRIVSRAARADVGMNRWVGHL